MSLPSSDRRAALVAHGPLCRRCAVPNSPAAVDLVRDGDPDGGPKDREAAPLLAKAAEAGNPDAENDYGYILQDGCGVPEDDADAVNWDRASAAQGNMPAMRRLGYLYLTGTGTSADAATAKSLFQTREPTGGVHVTVEQRIAAGVLGRREGHARGGDDLHGAAARRDAGAVASATGQDARPFRVRFAVSKRPPTSGVKTLDHLRILTATRKWVAASLCCARHADASIGDATASLPGARAASRARTRSTSGPVMRKGA